MAAVNQIKAIYAMGSSLGINKNSREDELHSTCLRHYRERIYKGANRLRSLFSTA